MKQVVINLHANMESTGLIHGQDWIQHAMVHDEIQVGCKKQHVELLKEKALISFPQAQRFFNFRCDIEGDAKVGHTWAMTH